jgi:uncharacterized cupredoxin-like copper-binding protein
MRTASRFALACLATASLAALIACDGNGSNTTDVFVTQKEFFLTLSRPYARAGSIRFEVTNAGTEDHEFLVIKTDLAPANLPTEANGTYEEDGPGTDLIEEISVVHPGQRQDLTLDLTAGNYVLICNMFEDGEAHYSLGMHVGFTVTS